VKSGKTISTPAEPVRQSAELSLRLGKHAGLDMRVRLTSRGILAIGGLVSSILLSTAVLVAVSLRDAQR